MSIYGGKPQGCSGLDAGGAKKRKCEVGDMFEMEGYEYVVVETDGVEKS
jgi:hypothetical protein